MKDVRQTLLERRTNRRYERQEIEQEKLDFIYEAIRNTPTSYNGQQFSVIAVTDQPLKETLYEITGQKQIKTCAVFLVFCLDYHKLRIAGKLKGMEAPDYAPTIDGYTVGVIDASLALMSATVAAESLGLGCCAVGYIRTANPAKVSELLSLPKEVAIVCGLTIGYPREIPDPKPKLPLNAVVHQNQYSSDDEMKPWLAEYDEKICRYNCERSGDRTTNDWATHVLDYHCEAMTHSIAGYLEHQLGLKCGKK